MIRDCLARGGQRGSALICVLMVTTLLATLSGALVLVVMSESMASANHGAAQQALYAAEAALEDTLSELQTSGLAHAAGSGGLRVPPRRGADAPCTGRCGSQSCRACGPASGGE